MRRFFALFAALAALSSHSSAAEQGDLFMETGIDPRTPYVQEHVLYTVRLYAPPHSQRESFIIPESLDLMVRFLSEDDPVEITKGGRSYHMTERRYVLIPLRSGVVTVPGVIYSGRGSYLHAPDEVIDVRPVPAGYDDGEWLPARRLTVEQQWNPSEPSLRVGDQLERATVVTAEGLTGAQIPPLPLPEIDGMRVYRTGSSIEDLTGNRVITGRRMERIVFVPEREGIFLIPAVEIRWWNTAGDRAEKVRLSGRKLKVEALPADAAGPTSPASKPAAGFPGQEPSGNKGTVPAGLLLLLLFSGSLVPVILRIARSAYFAGRRRAWKASRELKRACMAGDPERAAAAVLEWGRCMWSDDAPLSLLALAARMGGEAGSALLELDAALYGGRSGRWDGSRLYKEIRRFSGTVERVGSHHRPRGALPPLGPPEERR